MSIHDETWDKDLRRELRQAGNLGSTISRVQSVVMNEKQQPPKVALDEIPLDNILALAGAIDAAGGNPFSVLKEFRKLLNILASNNIAITATYHGPRKP